MTSVNHPFFAAAVRAVGLGDVEALRALLERSPELVHQTSGAPLQATLLHCTSFNAVEELCHTAPPTTPDVARLLLERGAAVDALASGYENNTALCWALSSWFTFEGGVQAALADAYLDGGAALEGVAADGAPLGHSIAFGYTATAEHLARRGARVDNLVAASALGHLESLRDWFQAGRFAPEALAFTCRTDAQSGRFSWPPPRDSEPASLALQTAATHGRCAVVAWLLEAGVDPNGSVARGQTALHFAAYQGHGEIVRLLLAAGASSELRETQFQRTAAEWARETGRSGLAKRLDSGTS